MKLEDALRATSRGALTTVFAVLDTGVNIVPAIAKPSAVLDRQVIRVPVPYRCERGQ